MHRATRPHPRDNVKQDKGYPDKARLCKCENPWVEKHSAECVHCGRSLPTELVKREAKRYGF